MIKEQLMFPLKNKIPRTRPFFGALFKNENIPEYDQVNRNKQLLTLN